MRLPFANKFGYYPTLQQFKSIWMRLYVWPKYQVGVGVSVSFYQFSLFCCVYLFRMDLPATWQAFFFFYSSFSLISKQPDMNNDWVSKANKPIWLMKFSSFSLFGNIHDLWPLRRKKRRHLMFFLFVALLSRDFVPHSIATYLSNTQNICSKLTQPPPPSSVYVEPESEDPTFFFCNKEIKNCEIKQINLRHLSMFVYKNDFKTIYY